MQISLTFTEEHEVWKKLCTLGFSEVFHGLLLGFTYKKELSMQQNYNNITNIILFKHASISDV